MGNGTQTKEMIMTNRIAELAESFNSALEAHIEFCVDDQLDTFNNIVSINDYTPLWNNFHEYVENTIVALFSEREYDSIAYYDEKWCTIHDTIDFHNFVECSDKVIKEVR